MSCDVVLSIRRGVLELNLVTLLLSVCRCFLQPVVFVVVVLDPDGLLPASGHEQARPHSEHNHHKRGVCVVLVGVVWVVKEILLVW